MNQTRQSDIILKFLMIAMVMSAFISGLVFEYRFIKINLSQVIALLVFGWLLSVSIIRGLPIPFFFKDLTTFFIFLYFLSNFFSSIVLEHLRNQSLKGCLVILTYVFIYFTTRWALKFIFDSEPMIGRLMRYNLISALLGLGCMIVALVTGRENFGVSYGQLDTAGISTLQGHVPSIKSLAIEPNLFSIGASTVLCLNLAIYILWKKPRKQLLIIAILSVAIIFAYTRSVYIAILISTVCMLIVSKRIKALKSVAIFGGVVILIITSLFIFLPQNNQVREALEARARTLVDFSSGSGLGRMEGYRTGYQGFLESPLFGKGTLAANTTYFDPVKHSYEERMGSPGWLTGVGIQAIHDTGLMGIVIILGIFISVLYANYKVFILLDNDRIEKSIVMGFMGGNIILFITSQISSPFWISFPYIYWALNLAFIAQCKKRIQDQKGQVQ